MTTIIPKETGVSSVTDQISVARNPQESFDTSTIQYRVIRRRKPVIAILAVIALVLLAQFIHGLIANPGWKWDVFAEYFSAPIILSALWMTIKLTIWGTVLGFGLGLLIALARVSGSIVLQTLSWIYIWAFRSIPLIVQLLFWFNIAYLYRTLSLGVPFGPELWKFDVSSAISGFTAAVIGLGLHQAAYSAEIIRAGLNSVDPGQKEAAEALGIPRRRQFFTIILPQAMRGILPNATNEIISLFKGTSIVSTVAIAELFYQVQVIYGRSGDVVPLLAVATVWYIVLTSVLSVVQYYIERHYSKGASRNVPLPLRQRVRLVVSRYIESNPLQIPRGATR